MEDLIYKALIPYNKNKKNEGIEEINEALEYGKRNPYTLKQKDQFFSSKFGEDAQKFSPLNSNSFLTKEEKDKLKKNKNLGLLSPESVSGVNEKIASAIKSPDFMNPILKNVDDNSAFLIMPSSSGRNIIPNILASSLKSVIKDTKGYDVPLITNFAKPLHYFPAEEKDGVEMLVDPIDWKVNEGPLYKYSGKKLFFVDDIFDSGNSVNSLSKKLGNYNLSNKVINLGLGDFNGQKASNKDILLGIEKYQDAFPDISPKDIHDSIHFNIGGKSPEFINRFLTVDLSDDISKKKNRKNLLSLIEDFKNKEKSWNSKQ